MLHRQIMFKQLQAMQQQYLNQFMPPDKQNSSGLQNGMPMQDSSQMFMGGNTQLPQHVQGFQSGFVFSHGQSQPVYSMGFSPQLDMASYGNDMNSFSQIQGAYQDPANAMNMGSNSQLQMPLMQQSIPSNSFGNEQLNVADGGFSSKSFGNKNFFGQPFMQASEPDSALKNTSLMVSAMGQEQGGWPLHSADKTARFEASHSTDSLDPLEAKILFNTDDTSWGSSICQQSNVDTSGYKAEGNLFNSGSWSALMQSAVAEASSSDTGQQEEWSGLTYQNPELSADNDHANYIGNSQSWADTNLQNISSPPLNTEPHFQHSNMTYSFPSFQETNHQVAMQKEGIQSDFLHQPMQQPQKNVNNWVGSNNSQQKLSGEEFQLVQTSPQTHTVWNDRPPQQISSYTVASQSSNSMKDEQKESVWQHESVPQHMAEQMQSADQISSSQVSQLENCSNNLCPEPSQHIANSYSSPLQANSHVTNTWYQNNALQFPQKSDSFVANQSPHATFPGARDVVQANAIHLQQFGGVEQRDKIPLSNVQNFNALDRNVGPNFSLLQQVNTNVRQQLFNLQSGAGNVGQGNVNSQLIFNSFGENKPMHSSSGFVGDQSGYSDPRNHPSIQMGPQQYGTAKIGQMLPFTDSTLTTTTVKQFSDGISENIQENDFTGQKDLSNASQVRSGLPNLDIANVTAPYLLGEKEQNLAELIPQKRKRVPWHEEVTQSSHSLQKLSSLAESLWERASNRLSEKVEAETETTWDVDPRSRAKKRLNLSTKLMQRVFRPAPAVVLSAEASSNIESMVYFTARFSLGDASSWTNSTSDSRDMPSKMPGTSERNGRPDFPKYVENFNARAKKIEDAFLRMEKTLSVGEIKLETQELEKYSVINRFAKFHRKVPNVPSADPSTTPADAGKPLPQRYVVALPMPNVVPETASCLSL